MKFNYIILVFILLFSCKNIKVEEINSNNYSQATPNIEIQNHYTDSVLKLLKRVRYSDKLEPNGGRTIFEIIDKSIGLEVLEQMETGEKIIDYYVTYKSSRGKHNETTQFFNTKNNNTLIVIYDNYIYNRMSKEDIIIAKDTFFFKNDKIYFWKNKEATDEELLAKEKEILIIKREVDSILNI